MTPMEVKSVTLQFDTFPYRKPLWNGYDSLFIQTPRAGKFFIRNSPFKSFMMHNFDKVALSVIGSWRNFS